MGLGGLEPPTSRLSGVRSNHLSYKPFGGDEEIRTPDPLLARQVLSQLSYTPDSSSIFILILRCCSALAQFHTLVCAFARSSHALYKNKSLRSSNLSVMHLYDLCLEIIEKRIVHDSPAP